MKNVYFIACLLTFAFSVEGSSTSSSSSTAVQAADLKGKQDYEAQFHKDTEEAIFLSLKEEERVLENKLSDIKNKITETAYYKQLQYQKNAKEKAKELSFNELAERIYAVPFHTDPKDQKITFEVQLMPGKLYEIGLYGKDSVLTLLREVHTRFGLKDSMRFWQNREDIVKNNLLRVIKIKDLGPSKKIHITLGVRAGVYTLEEWNQFYNTQMGE